MKKLFTIIAILTLTAVLSMSAFAATESQDPLIQALQSNITSDSNTDLIVAASEAKDDAVLKSDIKSFKGKFTNQFEQLEGLKTECKDLWSQIKTANQSIKTAWSDLKTSLKGADKEKIKTTVTALRGYIDPLRTHIQASQTDIRSLRSQKATEWKAFRAAVKANDEAKATIALNNIISLKTQIIYKQKEIVPFKNIMLSNIKK